MLAHPPRRACGQTCGTPAVVQYNLNAKRSQLRVRGVPVAAASRGSVGSRPSTRALTAGRNTSGIAGARTPRSVFASGISRMVPPASTSRTCRSSTSEERTPQKMSSSMASALSSVRAYCRQQSARRRVSSVVSCGFPRRCRPIGRMPTHGFVRAIPSRTAQAHRARARTSAI